MKLDTLSNIKFISFAKLSTMLPCSKSWLYKQFENGQIPGVRLAGKVCFIESEVLEWIDKQRFPKGVIHG